MLSIRSVPKPIIWMGSSYEDLRAFPEGSRRHAGYQLHRIQAGLEAEDWRAMTEIGPGTAEIRLRDGAGAEPGGCSMWPDLTKRFISCTALIKNRSIRPARIKPSVKRVTRPWCDITGGTNDVKNG